jgi:hypothetical protein
MCFQFTILLLLACAIPLRSQSWDSLRSLKSGERVYVLDSSGKEHKGTFSRVSDEAIAFTEGKSEISLQRARVRRVRIPSSSRRLRNTLIGVGIGVAVGVTTDQTLGSYLRNESAESTGARALTYVAPIALFGGIAAALPGRKTVYRAR